MSDTPLDLLTDLIRRAKLAGADEADALAVRSLSLGASWRLGRPEDIERSEAEDLGLRVFVGRSQAFVSTTDRSAGALDELVRRAVLMARSTPEDPYCGLADPDLLCAAPPELDLCGEGEPTIEKLVARARACEEAALAVAGVTNSEGAGASWGRTDVALATSGGFTGAYSGTQNSVSVSVIAGESTGMERDYDYSSARHQGDLESAAEVGKRAGERAVRRLGARKVASRKAPVVYDPRVAGGLLGHLAAAISGPAIARGTSFLKDRLGQQVFAPGIQVIDDPHRRRGLRSRPFDAEGVANRRQELVSDGHLATWLLDSASARQLRMRSTGHATRGAASPPSPAPTNLYLAPGPLPPETLIGDIDQGLYVTELIGFGVNGVTGDYSRGAAGFWIEKGAIAYPVSEITIAGNLKDMFRHLTPASDLVFRHGTDSPTVRIDAMTIAGM